MSLLAARVSEDVRRRVERFARERGFTHPSRRPNLSAATREILDAGLQVVEAGAADKETSIEGGSGDES